MDLSNLTNAGIKLIKNLLILNLFHEGAPFSSYCVRVASIIRSLVI
jgi:hypothetical protein